MLGSSKPAAANDPLAQIDRLPLAADEAQARLLCQQLLSRELGREPVYRRLLEVVLGFCQRPVQTSDGGWIARPRKAGPGKDARVPLLTSDPRFAWNALHILKGLRDTREIQLDETMLPYRSQDYLNGDPLFEEVTTDNAKHLWQRIYYTRTLPRAAPAPATTSSANNAAQGGAPSGQPQLPPLGGGAVVMPGAAGSDASSTGLTRLPLLLPLLDHYFFCFAYWAVARKRSSADYGGVSMVHRKQLYEYELLAAQGLVTPQGIVAKQGVYFELLQAYVQGFFPRETGPDTKGLPVDLERALRVTPEADKFLRVFIESWLERNAATNPNLKPQAEPSVAEHQLHPSQGQYQPPTVDALHGLLLLVGHLVARRVDADVAAAQAQGNRARLVQSQYGQAALVGPLCPALDALQQPLFVFLCLAFRHLRVAPLNWTQFLLAGELWLAWIDPDRTWRQAFPEPAPPGQKAGAAAAAASASASGARGAAGARWRELHLKAYVASNLHFYTTLFVLYMRKAREALGSDASRQHQVLCQALRVMRVFRDTALHDALSSVSRHAAELWQQAGANPMLLMRAAGAGQNALLYHLRALRLLRSRPCLVADACQDAHHLAAELLAAKRRAEKDWDALQRSWFGPGKWGSRIGDLYRAWFTDQGTDEPPSGGHVTLPELISKMDLVLAEVFGIFPSVEAKCSKPLGDAESAANRDAERRGLLLTARGREQLLLGVRGCDPTKARYLGDPLFSPERGDFELPFLVPWAQWCSVRWSRFRHPDWEPSAEAARFLAAGVWQQGQGDEKLSPLQQKEGHIDLRRRSTGGAPTPSNFRPWMADMRFFVLASLLLCGLLVFLLGVLNLLRLGLYAFLLAVPGQWLWQGIGGRATLVRVADLAGAALAKMWK